MSISFSLKLSNLSRVNYFSIVIGLSLLASCSSNDDDSSVVSQEEEEVPTNIIVVESLPAGNIGNTSAILLGKYEVSQDLTLQEIGFIMDTEADIDLDDQIILAETNNLTLNATLDCMEPVSAIYYKAFVKVDDVYYFGDELNFATLEHKIYDGSINLESQSEVDSFGAEGYTRVAGELVIGFKSTSPYSSNITDLSPLKGLTEFRSLTIGNNPDLVSTSGLECLKRGDFENTYLGKIFINIHNNGITNVDFLADFEASPFPGTLGLKISGTAINSIDGLKNLRSAYFLTVASTSVNDLTALQNLGYIQGDLVISNNDNIVNLDGLQNVSLYDSFVNPNFYINSNENLISLEGLNGIPGWLDDFWITNNPNLRDFCSLKGSGYAQYFFTNGNFYNPTLDEIRNGQCSI